MNADQLRAAQAPFKEKYRQDPASALVTLTARGELAPGITCRVRTPGGEITAGLHPATGGDGQGACSAQMLLEALASCAGVTLNAVATAIGVTLRSAVIEAAGELDFRGTLGVSKEAPIGFKHLTLRFMLDSDAPSEQLAKLLQLTERYCVVLQTLKNPPQIEAVVVPR